MFIITLNLNIVSCTIPDIILNFHDNRLMRFSPILLTVRQADMQIKQPTSQTTKEMNT